MGPSQQQCHSCKRGDYLDRQTDERAGECLAKREVRSLHSLVVSNVISVIENGNHSDSRDGTPTNPFIDMRDALKKAQELAGPFTRVAVEELLTKGSHFILISEPS